MYRNNAPDFCAVLKSGYRYTDSFIIEIHSHEMPRFKIVYFCCLNGTVVCMYKWLAVVCLEAKTYSLS